MDGSRKAAGPQRPDLQEELCLLSEGHSLVAGVDEAGRGPWAGPVCAAAIVLPLNRPGLLASLDGVRDSKKLSAGRREALLPGILAVAASWGVGWASSREIDARGIAPATRQAMLRAIAGLDIKVDALLIDYVNLPEAGLPQRSVAHADALCLSVAAASILAKVSRDRLMTTLDVAFPGYGFASHKGYGTRQHREALARLGPCPIHRMTWRPVKEARSG